MYLYGLQDRIGVIWNVFIGAEIANWSINLVVISKPKKVQAHGGISW
jgi:hypothetical protein